MATADDFRDLLLALPAGERASLARELLLSLENADFESDVECDWAEEVERRAQAYANDETTSSDWRDSVERAREALRKRRDA